MNNFSFCADAWILLTKLASTTVSGASAGALPKKVVISALSSISIRSVVSQGDDRPLKSWAHGSVEAPPGVDHW